MESFSGCCSLAVCTCFLTDLILAYHFVYFLKRLLELIDGILICRRSGFVYVSASNLYIYGVHRFEFARRVNLYDIIELANGLRSISSSHSENGLCSPSIKVQK